MDLEIYFNNKSFSHIYEILGAIFLAEGAGKYWTAFCEVFFFFFANLNFFYCFWEISNNFFKDRSLKKWKKFEGQSITHYAVEETKDKQIKFLKPIPKFIIYISKIANKFLRTKMWIIAKTEEKNKTTQRADWNRIKKGFSRNQGG